MKFAPPRIVLPQFRNHLIPVLVFFLVSVAGAQTISDASILRGIDASVSARDESIVGYTVTEHYAVFRNQDQQHPAAEMTVLTTYRQNAGKSYQVLARSGSELIQREVLDRVLDNERTLTAPLNRPDALITSKNYNMTVAGTAQLNGRNCLTVAISPKRLSPYLFKGTIWVDAQSYDVVQLEGVASKSPSLLTGAPQVFRQYEQNDGFPMATHAKAVSDSWLLGQTTVKIDYSGYVIELRAPMHHEASPTSAPANNSDNRH